MKESHYLVVNISIESFKIPVATFIYKYTLLIFFVFQFLFFENVFEKKIYTYYQVIKEFKKYLLNKEFKE